MSDIFQEVDEEVRKDQYFQLWRAYGKYMFIGAAAIVFGTAAGVGWRGYDQSQRLDASHEFEKARTLLAQENDAAALQSFARLAQSGWGTYSVLAGFQEAAARAADGDREGAVAAYGQIAAETGERVLRDFAKLRAAMLLMDETGQWTEARGRLEEIAGEADPWRYSAREFLAVLARAERRDEDARSLYAGLAVDPETPRGIKTRAIEMMAALELGK